MTKRTEKRIVEAILFAATAPQSEERLAERLPDGTDVAALLDELRQDYAKGGVNLIRVAGGWAFRTAEDLAPHLRLETKVGRRLSRAAVETLAIIAYHQPATRTEVEEIRGVSVSRGSFEMLLELGWIRPMGRRRTPGRPTTWGTTPAFLEHFGLADIADLPGIDELKASGLLDARPAVSVIRGDSEPDSGADRGIGGGGGIFARLENSDDDDGGEVDDATDADNIDDGDEIDDQFAPSGGEAMGEGGDETGAEADPPVLGLGE